MKTNHTKLFTALIGAASLSAAIFIATPTSLVALAFERVTGQDKTGKNCERVDSPGSSTFGKCESVCKDKEVTRDALNNRWVCKAAKTVNTTPLNDHVTGGVKVLDAGSNPKPKQPAVVSGKAGKTKKG